MPIRPLRRRAIRGAATVVLLALAGCTSTAPEGGSSSVVDPSSASTPAAAPTVAHSDGTAGASTWLGYHADLARTGDVHSSATFAAARVAWSDDLGGVVHGQVVAADGLVVAATERNRVVALDPATGGVVWSRSLGPPLTDVSSSAGCGDIDPLGITSTPVIDPTTGTVFVVAEVADGHGGVLHRLEGLAMANGSARLDEVVDPPLPRGEHPVNLLQRAGLALAGGRVYIAYGGNDGDCGEYHGWIVGVDEAGPAHEVSFEVASDGEGGAIWQSGGAPAVDAAGNVYVTTGNANPDPPQGGPDPKRYTESVVKLSPALHPLVSFKDRVAGGDEDLSTGNPVLLPGGLVFAVGKTDIGYLLRQSDLAEVAAVPRICGSDPDGGPAYAAAAHRLYVPCRDGGLQTVLLNGHGGRVGAHLQGADSAPIVIDSTVWALDHLDGVLYAYDAGTGRRQQAVPTRAGIPVFSSPSTADGMLFVSTTRGVTALR